MAPIAVGDVIPNDTLAYFDKDKPSSSASSVPSPPLVVNDPFMMKAWAKTYPENKDVLFLADGSAKYTHDLGLELDLSEKGLGTRFKRFALRFNTHDFSKSDTLDELSIITLNYLGCSLQLQVLKSTSGLSHLSQSDRESKE
ncbi:hypothetical protein COP1_003111 [Malus domestica]